MSSFQWDPRDYQNHSSQQALWAGELIEKLHLAGGESILDIGCGDGKVTAQLARVVPEGSVTGIDSSESMVAFARRQFPRETYPNLDFLCMNALEISFEGIFDQVFSNATLHWITDHPAVLRGIGRSLRPGGRALLQMGGRGNAEKIIEIVNRLMEHPEWRGYFTTFVFPYGFYGPEEYQDWLEQAGLKPLRVELLVKDMVQTGADGLAGWIRTTWLPYTVCVPEDKREQFIEELVEQYLEEYPLGAAGWAHIRMVRLEVEARKT